MAGWGFMGKIMRAGAAAVLAWGMSKLFYGKAVLPDCVLNFDGLDNFDVLYGTLNFDGLDGILNFDGLKANLLTKAGAGCVIRDKEGELIVAAAYNLGDCCHEALAEALALRNGLALAKASNIKLSLIQGDSFETIQRVRVPAIISLEPTVPLLRDLIQEIRCAFNEQSIDLETQLRLTIRERNEVAHELALLGQKLPKGRPYVRTQNLPPGVAALIGREKLIWDQWLDWIMQD